MAMPLPLDARLRDEAALAELELTSRVMIAVSDYERRLTQQEVDEILGVVARRSHAVHRLELALFNFAKLTRRFRRALAWSRPHPDRDRSHRGTSPSTA